MAIVATAASTPRTTRPTRGCRASCSARRWRSSSRRTRSAACPGRGARARARRRRRARHVRACIWCVRGTSRFPFTTSRRPERVPRRVPARRHRDAARDRGRRASRAPTSGPCSVARPLRWIGVRSYSLYLWHYPIFCITRPRPRRAARTAGRARAPPRAVVRRRRAVVPLRRDADPRRRDRPVPRPARRPSAARPAPRSRARGVVDRSVSAARGDRARVSACASAAGRDRSSIPGRDRGARKAGQRRRQTSPTRETHHHGCADEHVATTADADPSGTRHDEPRTATRARPGRSRATTSDPLAHEILAIGDSVMLGAEQSLSNATSPAIFVDAKVSRQFWDATLVLQALQERRACSRRRSSCTWAPTATFSDAQFDADDGGVGNRHGVLRQRARAATVGDRGEQAPRGRRGEVPERAPDRLARRSRARTPTGSSATASTSPAPARGPTPVHHSRAPTGRTS